MLMISLVYDKRSIPIYFELLPKLGSSNFAEQKTAIDKVLPLFKDYKTVVLGDREFCSVTLARAGFVSSVCTSVYVSRKMNLWKKKKKFG